MYLSELNREPQESCHIELQETTLGEGRIADGEERKTSVLQELKRHQEKIRIQEEQKKRKRKTVKDYRSNDVEL